MWGGPGNGEICDGCGETVTKTQVVMEGLSGKDRDVQFHVACFYVWDAPSPWVQGERAGG